MHDGFMSSFAIDFEEMRNTELENEWKAALQEFQVSGGYHVPIRNTQISGNDSQGNRTVNGQTATTTITWNPMTHWQASVTGYKYIDGDAQQPWNPDFTYSFGYSDWHPYTLSLLYSNYGGNRISPDKDKGEKITRFNEGTWSLGWSFVFSEEIERLLRVHDSGGLNCGISYNINPRFVDPDFTKRQKWKQHASLNCKYSIYKNFYINATANWYPDSEQQQPWDADYTYGFGYFDWHPGTFSLQYNNYAGNRYPWRDQPDDGDFTDGVISLTYTLKW